MSKDRKWLTWPSKKTLITLGILAIAALLLWLIFGLGMIDAIGEKDVEFTPLSKEKIPKEIDTEIVPEYRELERALGCLIDGKVYVLVTRGEKPTSGYDVSIEKMTIEKKDGKQNLKVQVLFQEPEEGIAQAQVTTFPYVVATTDLTVLPDSIELISKY